MRHSDSIALGSMHPSRPAARRALCAAVTLALTLLALGCGGAERGARAPQPDEVLATGRAEIPGRDLLVQSVESDSESGTGDERLLVRRRGERFPPWADESLHARNRVAVPENAPSRATALMLARREAIDQLLGELALEVSRLPAPEGGTVGDFLLRNPDVRGALEEAVRSSAIPVHGEADERGNYEMILRLPLEPIALIGWGEMREETAGDAAPALGASLQGIARERAEAEARRLLLERVQAVELYPNYTIQDLMSADQAAAEHVREAVADARIRGVRQPSPGMCEVDLVLEMAPLLDKLDR